MIRNAGAICDRRLIGLLRQCVESERSSAHGEDGLEAAKDKASGVEWRFPGRIQTLVLMHLRFGGPEACLVWPDLPGEYDLLTNFRSDSAAEVSLFAVGNVVLPALNDFQASIVLEDLRPVLGPFAVGLHPVLRHGDHKARDVHCSSSFIVRSAATARQTGTPKSFPWRPMRTWKKVLVAHVWGASGPHPTSSS